MLKVKPMVHGDRQIFDMCFDTEFIWKIIIWPIYCSRSCNKVFLPDNIYTCNTLLRFMFIFILYTHLSLLLNALTDARPYISMNMISYTIYIIMITIIL